MKKHIILFSLLMVSSVIATLLLYIFLGSRSIFFKIFVILILVILSIGIFYFKNYIQNSLKRGKLARIKIFESFSILFFGVALFILIQSFDINIDWTSEQLFRLSSQTKEIVKKIETPLNITLFFYDDKNDPQTRGIIKYAEKLAKRYEALSKNISFKIIDPIRDKRIADEHGIQQNGTILFEMNNLKEFVLPTLLMEQISEDKSSYKGESIFSAVIDKLIQNKVTKIYYLTGQGELDFQSSGAVGYNGVLEILKNRRYEISALNLNHYPEVPQDANLVIIADSQTDFSSSVFTSLENFITKKNGSVLYLVGQTTSSSLNPLLFLSGFAFIPNVAIDPSLTAKNNSAFSIIPYLSPKSDITKLLSRNNLGLLFPSSSIVNILTEKYLDQNYIYDIFPLARMSKQGFGETSFKQGVYQKDEKDIEGISTLAIASIVAEKENLEIQRRAIIIGSLDFIDNSRINFGGNAQFLLNSIEFLLRNDLNTVVPAKNQDYSVSIANPTQIRAISVATFIWILLWIVFATILLALRRNQVKEKK